MSETGGEPMRVLVLGGTGFIGSRAVTRLASMGHEVAVFSRGKTRADLPREVRRLVGDQAELGRHVRAFRDFSADVVVGMHLMSEREATAFTSAFAGLTGRALAISSVTTPLAEARRLLGSSTTP